MCWEHNSRLIDETATLAASCLGSGLPALIRSSLCENLGWCSEAGQGDRGKGKFSGAVELSGI